MTQNDELVLLDRPHPAIVRLTLNRPDKRNALSNELRAQLLEHLERADCDDSVHVAILRGGGSCFSAGYDLAGGVGETDLPYHSAPGAGRWARHVVDGCFRFWDLGIPVIAQVHGWCLAGGSELATACDLVYVADDCRIGYPPVRSMSPPDNQFHPWLCGMRAAMEMMLTGDAMDGAEAVRTGFANRSFAADQLEKSVLDIARRVALVPREIQSMNKRSVHRAMEVMGLRAAIRAGTEIQALAMTTAASRAAFAELGTGLTKALSGRDKAYGDYRTAAAKQGSVARPGIFDQSET